MRGVELAPVEQELEHDRRRGEGDEVAEEEAAGKRIPAGRGDGQDEGDGDGDLDRPRHPHELAEPAQVAERKLEADGEEEQNDAEIRQDLDDLDVGEHAEPERTEEGAGREEADERRLTQPMQQVRGAEGREEDQREWAEKFRRLHRGSLCASRDLW